MHLVLTGYKVAYRVLVDGHTRNIPIGKTNCLKKTTYTENALLINIELQPIHYHSTPGKNGLNLKVTGFQDGCKIEKPWSDTRMVVCEIEVIKTLGPGAEWALLRTKQ